VDWSKTDDNSDYGLIATASGDDAIRIIGKTPGGGDENYAVRCTAENAHQQDVNGIAWNPKEFGVLASASDDGTVKIWSVVADPDDVDLTVS